MQRFLFVALCAFTSMAFANDLAHAPQNFAYAGGQAVFVDFTKATYNLRYDIVQKLATVHAVIEFTASAEGHPVFDLVNEPTAVKLNGAKAVVETIKLPGNVSQVRVLGATVKAGTHTMEITAPVTELVEMDGKSVKSAFWTTDLDDRGYLEQYLPANMEFDRVPMTFNIEFVGLQNEQRIYTNGVVTKTGEGQYQVVYPEYFTSSSLFFHTTPVGAMAEKSFTYRSIDGRELPVVVYKKPSMWGSDEGALTRLQQQTVTVLTELENDYGPFLHPSVTIYNAGSGGMEYCGATMTDTGALGHELTHSYFARGLMPANGNAGWIDEALASWRDNNYPRLNSLNGSANMAGRLPYTRFTDMAAYSFGARFMGYLDGKFAGQGGLKSLLRKLVEEKSFEPFFTENFIEWAEGHYRMDLKAEFKARVYGGQTMKQSEHPVHKKVSPAQLRPLL